MVFPPRLDIVVAKQNANGFPTDFLDHTAIDRLLHDQLDRPTSVSIRRGGAHHGDDLRLLLVG
jgi:hypothetical protein